MYRVGVVLASDVLDEAGRVPGAVELDERMRRHLSDRFDRRDLNNALASPDGSATTVEAFARHLCRHWSRQLPALALVVVQAGPRHVGTCRPERAGEGDRHVRRADVSPLDGEWSPWVWTSNEPSDALELRARFT